MLPRVIYQEETLDLTDGDVIVLYTDGLVEARDPEGRFYTLERLETLAEGLNLRAAAVKTGLALSYSAASAGSFGLIAASFLPKRSR